MGKWAERASDGKAGVNHSTLRHPYFQEVLPAGRIWLRGPWSSGPWRKGRGKDG